MTTAGKKYTNWGTEPREVMDIRQCSAYLQISADTLYKYATTGYIPAFKLGTRWRFKRSAIDEWVTNKSKENVKIGESK
jgi:excisionase family DNA binding protein